MERTAFELVLQAVGIRDRAAVVRDGGDTAVGRDGDPAVHLIAAGAVEALRQHGPKQRAAAGRVRLLNRSKPLGETYLAAQGCGFQPVASACFLK